MNDAALDWAVGHLGGRPVWLRTRPWAEVWRVDGDGGTWWLKINFAETVYEPRLLDRLASLGSPLVAPVVVHPSEPWSLIADAGRSARDLLAEATPEQRIDYWCRLLPAYAELQAAATGSALAGLGVPDFSPGSLLQRFDELVADHQWFTLEVAGGLGPDALSQVPEIRSRLELAAARLAGSVAPTVQHDDLHDANVFGDGSSAKVIDWGDAVLGHPFGTLLVTLDVLAMQLDTDRDDPRFDRVVEAYLEPWRTQGQSRAELRRELDLAVRTTALSRAAGWRRALGTPGGGVATGDADATAHWLLRLGQALADLV